MARMHAEVFEALRSVLPEEKAIQGAVALYAAVMGSQRGAESVDFQSAATSFDQNIACLASEVVSVRTGMRMSMCMMVTMLVLTTVIFLKVFFG